MITDQIKCVVKGKVHLLVYTKYIIILKQVKKSNWFLVVNQKSVDMDTSKKFPLLLVDKVGNHKPLPPPPLETSLLTVSF